MPLDTFIVVANSYDSEADALADFEAVRSAYLDLGIIDTYDAAVATRGTDGAVKIIKKTEEPVAQGAAVGLLGGLAIGALTAIFPAVTLAAGLIGGGAIGAASGVIAGHVLAGLPSEDMRRLGELLEPGQSGLLVIAARDTEAHIDAAITRAKKTVKTNLQADTDALKKAIDAL